MNCTGIPDIAHAKKLLNILSCDDVCVFQLDKKGMGIEGGREKMIIIMKRETERGRNGRTRAEEEG